MNTAKEIIERAFKDGYVVRVDDGDGQPSIKKTSEEAWAAITGVEEAEVLIDIADRTEWMLVIPHDVDEDETAANMTEGGWIAHVWDELMGDQGDL